MRNRFEQLEFDFDFMKEMKEMKEREYYQEYLEDIKEDALFFGFVGSAILLYHMSPVYMSKIIDFGKKVIDIF